MSFETGKFKAKGSFCIGDYQCNFKDIIYEISDGDYDFDTGFPEDQFSMVSQEKVSQKFDKNIWDLEITETKEI